MDFIKYMVTDIVNGRKKREALNRDGKYRYCKYHFKLGQKEQLSTERTTFSKKYVEKRTDI